MSKSPILIAGAGIGGLTTALTLHQIGVPCAVFEAVEELRPLGVGINLQPNAVRELFDLGISADVLDSIGIPAKEWALVGLNGNDIYAEPRGLLAGYRWPQYAVHRGELQMLLYRLAVDRLGSDCIRLGCRVIGYANNDDGGVTTTIERMDGTRTSAEGSLLVGADGLHSAVRQQMHPGQPPIHWGGTIMWRGTSPGVAIRTGSSFVGLGTHQHRLVFYPISHPDPDTGLAVINWIAEVTIEGLDSRQDGDWSKRARTEDVLRRFEGWTYDWLDVPDMLGRADPIYEFPMIDRDPIPTWQDGGVALLGDAAHVMYPTGSNGASQAIVDARVLGASLLEDGVNRSALQRYDKKLCDKMSALVLRNREAGPFGILQVVDERCGGVFERINDVVSPAEMKGFMADYKSAAGFAIEKLNNTPPTIPPGARLAA